MARPSSLHLLCFVLLALLVFYSSEAAAPGSPRECYDGYFKCADGVCIPDNLVCDGEVNCITGNDEESCARADDVSDTVDECFQGYFQCSNGLCIPDSLVCDGEINCVLGNDEDNC
ncbi:very low-density lipoprotein receptor-like [Eriocheir sinensis]|uniref:very low-density lipoprotein receptor-like n=1 Tax=Eriocheir sinensis TaxID=95602 RepID=UPI0021C707FA|nr:very low-density lipoprotein receptor-like [Eriocheir sinensis]